MTSFLLAMPQAQRRALTSKSFSHIAIGAAWINQTIRNANAHTKVKQFRCLPLETNNQNWTLHKVGETFSVAFGLLRGSGIRSPAWDQKTCATGRPPCRSPAVAERRARWQRKGRVRLSSGAPGRAFDMPVCPYRWRFTMRERLDAGSGLTEGRTCQWPRPCQSPSRGNPRPSGQGGCQTLDKSPRAYYISFSTLLR